MLNAMPGNPLTDPDWAPKLADTIERLVGNVRDKTTKRVLVVSRAVIFGVVIAFGGALAAVLLIIALFRGAQAVLDTFLDHHDSVWVSYLALGALFSIGGLIAMKMRFPKPAAEAA